MARETAVWLESGGAAVVFASSRRPATGRQNVRILYAARVLPQSLRARRTFAIVAAVLALIAFVGLVAHFSTAARSSTLFVVAVSPYLMLGAPVACVLVLLARHWVGLAVGVVLVVLCASTQLQLYVAQDAPANTRSLAVMTSNLRLGEASASSVMMQVRRNRVDVLMLEELTRSAQARLVAAGLDKLLRYHISEPTEGESPGGTGLWSRYPLSDLQNVAGFGFALVTARVDVPSVSSRPTLVALHMAGPVPYAVQWRHDMAQLPAELRALPSDAPVIVGGDFNATPDSSQFRKVVTHGYGDAADQAGAGITATYPSNRWFPPLIAIDHVLTRGGAVATSVRTVEISGSDHRALLVRVAVPR